MKFAPLDPHLWVISLIVPATAVFWPVATYARPPMLGPTVLTLAAAQPRRSATAWKPMGVSEDGQITLYIDTQRVTRPSPSRVRSWVRFDYKTPLQVGSKFAVRYLGLTEFDCKESTLRSVQSTNYYTDQSAEAFGEEASASYVTPDTLYDFARVYLCRNSLR